MVTGSLTGLTVIEASSQILGPLAAVMLGDQGADVIKVEGLDGDPARSLTDYAGYDIALPDGGNSIFEVMNRNKRSIAIDLGQERGRSLLRDLLATADGFIECFGPGVLDRQGLGYKDLAALNPRLVYAAGSANGMRGPDAGRPALDALTQARAGLMWNSGVPGDPPNWYNLGLADVMGASMLAYGVVAAVVARARTGVGQRVDVSNLMSLMWLEYWAIQTCGILGLGEWPRFDRENTRNPLFSHYRCADGEWIILGIIDHIRDWEPFCQLMGLDHLMEDPRFGSPEARIKNAKELVGELDKRFAEEPRAEWERRLKSHTAMVFDRVQRIKDLPNDPAVQANNYLVNVKHPRYGTVTMLSHPVTLKETPASIRRPAPGLGEHTSEILAERLHYSDEDVQRLRAEGVVA